MLRDTYVEINLDNMADNVKNIRQYVGKKTEIAAVIKANAYGHGAIEVAKTVMESGADLLAVATLTEALELRNAYPDYRIYIMGYTPDENMTYVVKHNFIQCIFSLKQGKILSALGKEFNKDVAVHIKYDTGFNRLGFQNNSESIEEILEIKALKNLDVEGIFSHFALAGDEENVNQFEEFLQAIELTSRDSEYKYRHICDSISAIDYPEFNLDMVRVGAILYGLKSFRKNDVELKPTLQFKTKVYFKKSIKKGEGVSYNYKWKAQRDSIIATIPVGYSDGYPRNMYEKGMVTIRGNRVPVIGVICMDQCMVDITDYPEIKEGDEVVIYGDGTNNSLTIQEVSKLGDTNKNELISRISRRTPRVYIKNNQVYKVLDYLLKESI